MACLVACSARLRSGTPFWIALHGFLLSVAQAQERREREPNSVYAERRAKIAAEVDGPSFLGLHGPAKSRSNLHFHQEMAFTTYRTQ